MKKILIGGSPCTYWSIAQTKGRETKPSGVGWELFENYLIAKEKFKPDLFLYEINVSAAEPIKEEIRYRLGVPLGPIFEYPGCPHYIEINSALVSAQQRKRFYVHNCGEVGQPEDRGIMLRDILETGTDLTQNEKAYCLTASYGGVAAFNTIERKQRTMVAERVPDYGSRDKARPAMFVKEATKAGYAEINPGECVDLAQENSKERRGRKMADKAHTLTTTPAFYEYCGTVDRPLYEVKGGKINIKGREYPIKLKDGFYIIRKLTVTECCRLQTMPDDYCRAVSKSQAYKCLGNGWTAEVIAHILGHGLRDVPRDEEIVVCSMYDGIATGRYVLDRLGFKNVKYVGYEIDRFAIAVALSNYPDIVEGGDAYQWREPGYRFPLPLGE